MVEITHNLFVGNQLDYTTIKDWDNFSFINAAKEPYHRQALGYVGRSCDSTHPEYLFAYRDNGNRLICNLVDSPNVNYIRKEIIDECIMFINEKLLENKKVLINCNQGESRSAAIGMLYLATIGYFSGMTFKESEEKYRSIYPYYNTNKGMRDYACIHWGDYNE